MYTMQKMCKIIEKINNNGKIVLLCKNCTKFFGYKKKNSEGKYILHFAKNNILITKQK